MGFSEKVSGIYTSLEDKYFDVLDALDARGVPVYAYSDFFEDKGVPSFIVTISIFIAILILLSIVIAPNTLATGEITFNIKDGATGQGLQNVKLSVMQENRVLIHQDLVIGDGTSVNIPPLPIGTKLLLSATREGYQPFSGELVLIEGKKVENIYFEKNLTSIEAKLRLIDSETQTKVTSANVSVRYNNQEYTFFADSTGDFKNSSVPEGVLVLLKITADGYLPIEETIAFLPNTIKDISIKPDGSAFVGKAAFLIAVNNELNQTIENAQVTVYNKETGTILIDDVTSQGVVSGPIQTGIPLRITVAKEGYITFDTEKEASSITLRKQEERFNVTLKQGGEKLIVNVVNQLGLPLSGTIVQIFDNKNVKLMSKTTTSTGVEFSGLNPDSEIIITAYKEGFLANRIKVLTGENESAVIVLTEAVSMNSTRLDIFTIDELANPIPNAKLEIFIIEDGNTYPYGLDELSTRIDGFRDIIVQKEKTYQILADTDIRQGSTFVEVGEQITETKVYIKMEKKPSIVEITLRDIYGKLVSGKARVSGIDGQILFDGDIENGKIFFNAENRQVVDLEVTTDDGNVFKTTVNVKGKKEIEVIVYEKGSDALAPQIEFVRLENENGDTIQGITPGAFYYAVFKVDFPLTSEQAGVHIRTGLDSSEFADEDNIALFGIEINEAQVNYSYSFTKDPAPGNEAIDRSNQGFSGEANKWGEAVLTNPNGTYTLKAKIRVSEFTSGKVPIQYRAWAKVQSDFYRTPSDEVLGLNASAEEKNGLYATTLTKELVLYESLPECVDDLCVALNFVDENENFYDTLGFEAITGSVYGLEAEFTSLEGDYLQVNVTSDNNDVVFLGAQSGTTLGFTDRSTTSAQNNASTTVNITQNGLQKIRFYFKTSEAGAKTIEFEALGKKEIFKQIIFNSVIEKELIVELSEKNVLLGKNFTVRVLDSGLSGVGSALVKILNKSGEVVKSISGNNTEGFGLNGNYRVTNDLGVGIYTVEVSVPKYKTKQESLLISTTKVLSFTQEINTKMMIGEKQKIVTGELRNNSEFNISDLSYEVSDNENFKVTTFLPASMTKTSNQTIQINIEYIGTSESADETVTITFRGMVESSFLAETSGVVNISYNKKLDQSCLKITPTSLTMNLLGRAGSNDSDVIEVTNNCDQTIYLTNRTKENTTRSYIIVRGEDISLQPGETRNVTITANNLIERQFARNETFSYQIIWDSNYLTKRLNVTVNLINPSIALSYPAQITLFLAQDSPKNKAIAVQPIFVTNISQFPVEGITFSIDKDYGSSLSLSVEPNTAVSLEKGQSINPTRFLVAESSSKFSEPIKAKILITGQLGNLNNRSGTRDAYNYDDLLSGKNNLNNYTNISNGYSTGQETLGMIDVEVHYSGLDCLKASLVGDNTFNLSADGGQRSTQISLQNTCAEPVRVVGATAASREVILGLPVLVVSPGQNVHTSMSVLTLNQALKLERHPITVKGITEISQTPIDSTKINVNIYAGVDFSDEKSKATSGISVNVCGETQKATISTPLSASGTNCSEGYCDALQASEYLAKRLDVVLKKAKSQAYSAQNDIESMACGTQGFCTFGQLGVQSEEIELYLKSDIVSISSLKEEFMKLTSNTSTGFSGESTDYLIRRTAIGDDLVQFIASTGFGRQIFIDQQIEGCGYYRITINGAFTNSTAGVEFESPVIVLRVTQKIDTKECKQSIENLINFIPVDKGYELGNDRSTWATMTNAETKLEEIGKEISKKLFGENRFGSGSGNKINLSQGAVAGALAEICLSGSGAKKTINVTVNANENLVGEARSAFDAQIVKMVSEVSSGNFSNNCLVKSGENYNCVRLTDTGDVGGLKIDLEQNTLFFSEGESCISASVKSNVPEGVYFEIIPKEENKKFLGIRKIIIRDKTTKEIFYTKEYIGGGKARVDIDNQTFLEENDSQNETAYQKDIEICAQPGEFATASHSEGAKYSAGGVQFSIKTINKTSGNAEGKESEVITVSTGTLHPDDWLAIFFKDKARIPNRGVENPYYFRITWDGNPEYIDLSEYNENLRKLGFNPEFKIIGESNELKNTEIVSETKSQAKTSAMNHYFGYCMGVSAVCNTAYGGIANGLLSAVLDCGIPAATMMKGEMIQAYGPWRAMFESDLFKSLSGIAVIGGIFQSSTAEISPQDFSPVMIGTQSAIGGSVGGIERIMTGMGSVSKFNYSGTSGFIVDQVSSGFESEAKKMMTQMGVPAADVPTYATEYTTQFKSRLQSNLEEGFKKNLTNEGITGKIKNPVLSRKTLSDADVKRIINDSIKNSDPGLGKFLQTKGHVSTALNPAIKTAVPGLSFGTSAGEVDTLIRQKLQTYIVETPNPIYNPTSGKFVAMGPPIKSIPNASVAASNIADDIVDSIIAGKSGITSGSIASMKADIASGIAAGAGTYDDVATILGANFRTASTNPAYTDLFKLSTKQLDDVTNAIKGLDTTNKKALGSVDDALKANGFGSKLKNLFKSPRFYASLGFGVACGALSNYVGLKMYNDKLVEVEREERSEASKGLNVVFYKNNIYKVVLSKNIDGPLEADYSMVTGNPTLEEEMRQKLSKNNQDKIEGTFLAWDEQLATCKKNINEHRS